MKTTVLVLAVSIPFLYVVVSELLDVFKPLLAALGGAA